MDCWTRFIADEMLKHEVFLYLMMIYGWLCSEWDAWIEERKKEERKKEERKEAIIKRLIIPYDSGTKTVIDPHF